MNLLVLLFFIQNVALTALLGYKFVSTKDSIFRNFGIALLLNSVAFAIWSLAIIQQAADLNQYVTAGAIFFISSLVFLLLAGTQGLKAGTKTGILTTAVGAGIMLFYIRTFVYPSSPYFSPEGLFFFNLHPMVQMLYILGLSIAAFPAIEVVAAKFKNPTSYFVRYGFIIEVVGGIILITSTNVAALNILGWIMGTTYLVLGGVLLVGNKAWSK